MQKYSILQCTNNSILQYSNTSILQYSKYLNTSILQILQYFNTSILQNTSINKTQPLFSNKYRGLSELPLGTTTNYNQLLTSLPNHTIHTKKKKKKKNLNTTIYVQTLKSYCYKKGLLPLTANVFILTNCLGCVAVFWLIPGGSVSSILL